MSLYVIHFSFPMFKTAQMPAMTSSEKVNLIEEQMKTVQKIWLELKTEVNNLDRKRRKARKKEREGDKTLLVSSH